MTLEVTRGDDETLTVVVTDPDDGDALVDLTGVTLAWMTKRYHDDADVDALIAKETPTEIVIANQTTDKGEATIAIEAADTDDLYPGLYFWELQSVTVGEVKTLAAGRIRIAADLIRGIA